MPADMYYGIKEQILEQREFIKKSPEKLNSVLND